MACWCLLFTYDCDYSTSHTDIGYSIPGGDLNNGNGCGMLRLHFEQRSTASSHLGACNSYDCDWSYGPGETTPGPCLCGGAADGQYFDGVHEGVFFLSLNMPYIHAPWHYDACLRLMIVIGYG